MEKSLTIRQYFSQMPSETNAKPNTGRNDKFLLQNLTDGAISIV